MTRSENNTRGIVSRDDVFRFVLAVLFGAMVGILLIEYQIIRALSSVVFEKVRSRTANYEINQIDSDGYINWIKHNVSLLPILETLNSTNKIGGEAYLLKHNVRILCVLLVRTPSHASISYDNWAKNCNDVEFVSIFDLDEEESDHTIINLHPVSSWNLLCKSILYVNGIKPNNDWVLFVDDHTFVIVENLRYLLANLNPMRPYYLGHPFVSSSGYYNLAKSGFVLNRKAISLFSGHVNLTRECAVVVDGSIQEDVHLGMLLGNFGIPVTDTRNGGKDVFHGCSPWFMFNKLSEQRSWEYAKNSVYPVNFGHNCCSPYSISFHYDNNKDFYFMAYLIYGLRS